LLVQGRYERDLLYVEVSDASIGYPLYDRGMDWWNNNRDEETEVLGEEI
jgi:hypothetical protein